MISISATSYDPQGALCVSTRLNNPYQGRRRGAVTATLDGEASVYDGGYSITEQILTATRKYPSQVLLVSLQYLVAFYSEVILSCESGVFSAIPSFNLNKNTLTFSFRLTGRLDT